MAKNILPNALQIKLFQTKTIMNADKGNFDHLLLSRKKALFGTTFYNIRLRGIEIEYYPCIQANQV